MYYGQVMKSQYIMILEKKWLQSEKRHKTL